MPHDGNAAQLKSAIVRSELPMATSQGQFLKIKKSQRDKDLAWLEEQRRRDADPFEQAARFLRSRGFVVAPQEGSSSSWFVGQRRDLDRAGVIDLATTRGCSFERTIREAGKREAARK
jgi:hypothetical protein